jgi:phthalate 4,5-cis-dihydrodiol dehydrogenase
MTERVLRLGVVGLGKAFMLMLPGLLAHPAVKLVAAADPRKEARERFAADFGAKVYEDAEALAADPSVQAIYVASPHEFHTRHVCVAAAHRKHVLVEKPMALTLQDCQTMIEAVGTAGVHMVVGHSHSFDPPIARTRALIQSGEFGRLHMITAINFTDFLYRPRRPEELRTETGGGVIYNQAPHHVDVVRLLAGGRVKSVQALTGAWDETRPTEGAYVALLAFDGTFASLTYSGYAHFDSDEFMDWIAESGYPKNSGQFAATRALLAGTASAKGETMLKQAYNYGGAAQPGAPQGEFWHQQFGPIIASCTHADLRPVPKGVVIHSDGGRRFEPIDPPLIPRQAVIDEFTAAVFDDVPPLHDGAWGMATMEVCLAMLQSAREKREIVLAHQVGIA